MSNENIQVAVIGASGYTGEELIKLLDKHPLVDISCITSREHAGKTIGDLFPRLSHVGLTFTIPDVNEIATKAEVVFLCLPHGLSAEYAIPLKEKGLKIFDLGADFRLTSASTYKQYYGKDHPAPDLLAEAVYGLPEKNREKITSSELIACPGCYPTSIILPILPFLADNLISTKTITICSMSGVTGAGRNPSVSTMFSECNESIRSYNIVEHRHTAEIEQELSAFSGEGNIKIDFTPTLIPINRGINSVIFLNSKSDQLSNPEEIERVLTDFYEDEPFVRVLPHGRLADTKNVVHTNMCEIGFDYNPGTQRIIMTSAIDNLTKGAAGQAVQCMNIVYGFDETTGLV